MDSETDKLKKVAPVTGRVLPGAFELFKPSKRIINKNFTAYAWLAGLPIVLLTVSGLIVHLSSTSKPAVWGVSGVLELIGAIATVLFGPGLVLLQVASVRGKSLEAMDAYSKGLHYLWNYIVLGVFVVVLLSISLVLLIVPFFFVLPRVILAPYFMIDQDLSPTDALHASWEAYKKHGGVWGLIGVLVLLELPAIIPVVGPVAAAVLEFLYLPAPAIRYEQLNLLNDGKKPRTSIETQVAHAR